MKDVAHTIMEEEINKEDTREFSQNTKKKAFMYYYESLIKSVWKTEQNMYWKKKQLWKIVLKNKIFNNKKMNKNKSKEYAWLWKIK